MVSGRPGGQSTVAANRPSDFLLRVTLPARDPPIAVRAATVRDRTPAARSTTVALHLEELHGEVVRLAVQVCRRSFPKKAAICLGEVGGRLCDYYHDRFTAVLARRVPPLAYVTNSSFWR